jgi:hypothetical protein
MFNEKELKLLRLALDNGAHKGEIENAAVKFIYSLRERKFNINGEKHYAPGGSQVDHGKTILHFGKYKGRMIKDIDPDYLQWLIRWMRSDTDKQKTFRGLINAIETFLRS